MHIGDQVSPSDLPRVIIGKFTDMLNATPHEHDHEDDHDHEHEHDADAVLTAKTVTMVTLCLVSICMGVIPMQLAKCFKKIGANQMGHTRSLKYVNSLLGFGGGVLFSTTFLHMMPEVEEGVENLIEDGKLPQLTIPVAKVLTCFGFFMMYFVEEVVHSCTGHSHQEHARSPGSNTSSNVNIYSNNSIGSFGSVSTPDLKHHEKTCDIGHTHLDVLDDSLNEGAIRGLLIVLGLSVHELFEGLSIGLEGEANHVWYMFGAVAAHKFIIAFCIGVELTSSRTNTVLSYIYVCMFAVVSPLGIGIGMGLVGGHSAAASGLAAVVLQGIASGTLLYVVFFEILHKHRNGLLQYTSIAFGFALMAGIIAMNKILTMIPFDPLPNENILQVVAEEVYKQ